MDWIRWHVVAHTIQFQWWKQTIDWDESFAKSQTILLHRCMQICVHKSVSQCFILCANSTERRRIKKKEASNEERMQQKSHGTMMHKRHCVNSESESRSNYLIIGCRIFVEKKKFLWSVSRFGHCCRQLCVLSRNLHCLAKVIRRDFVCCVQDWRKISIIIDILFCNLKSNTIRSNIRTPLLSNIDAFVSIRISTKDPR